jgi:ATP-dependent Clp protease ATP-binding subunit ClpC
MFERYTEQARRTIFFARYEAQQFGGSFIEPVHLILGMLREDSLLRRMVADPEALRAEVERSAPRGERLASSVDMPLLMRRSGRSIAERTRRSSCRAR